MKRPTIFVSENSLRSVFLTATKCAPVDVDQTRHAMALRRQRNSTCAFDGSIGCAMNQAQSSQRDSPFEHGDEALIRERQKAEWKSTLLAIKEIGLHRSFAFDFERSAGLEAERITQCAAGRYRDVNLTGQAIALHALGGLRPLLEDPAGYHVAVADRLDGFEPIAECEIIELGKQDTEKLYGFLGRELRPRSPRRRPRLQRTVLSSSSSAEIMMTGMCRVAASALSRHSTRNRSSPASSDRAARDGRARQRSGRAPFYERAGFEPYEITYEKSVTHNCASE
jgi:hypothetical protein